MKAVVLEETRAIIVRQVPDTEMRETTDGLLRLTSPTSGSAAEAKGKVKIKTNVALLRFSHCVAALEPGHRFCEGSGKRRLPSLHNRAGA